MKPVHFFVVLLSLALSACKVYAKEGYGYGGQDWGHINVTKGGHMFYWLYETTAEVANYTERPLVIWLQGGPGTSSTGNGNFLELGPLHVNGTNRTLTWVKEVNVLFVDSPVGSGFSYVTDPRYFVTNNSQIVTDLMTFFRGFLAKHPEFIKVPLHIFSESYGGKVAAEFALTLYKTIQKTEIQCKLTSVVLGDPWISGSDSILSWAPYVFNLGIVDEDGFKKVMASANKTLEFVQQEKWIEAGNQFEKTSTVLDKESKGVNIYNIHIPLKGSVTKRRRMRRYNDADYQDNELETLMRGEVKKALNISDHIIWGAQKDVVFEYLEKDMMTPVINIVSELLDNTNVQVGVISGQLDLVCATPGTLKWIQKLQWKQRPAYVNAPREGIHVAGILEGYEKVGGNLNMFWINRAGHMAVQDNPAAANYVLKKITKYNIAV